MARVDERKDGSRRSGAAGARARRLLGGIRRYATATRLALFLVLVVGLVVLTFVGNVFWRIVALIVVVGVLVGLFAQLDLRITRALRTRRPTRGGPRGRRGPKAKGRRKLRSGMAPGAGRRRAARKVTIGGPSAVVTVVIPGKNEARFARDCIRSLKDQTLQNFEAVIIDDCSTDATLDVVLDEIGVDPRFRVLRTERSIGPGLARNNGVADATTKYVTFLDLDDYLAPDSLASRVECAERHADRPWVAGSYCWHEHVDVDAAYRSWRPPRRGRRGEISWMGHFDDNVVIVSTPLLRRDAFLAVGGFDDAPTAEDPIFWFKLLRWGFILVSTGKVSVAYRQKPSSRAVATAVEMRDAVARLLEQRTEEVPVPAAQSGPFYFTEGIGSYRTTLGYARRTAAALGLAMADAPGDPVIDRLVDDLRGVPSAIVGWEVDVRGIASGSARRVTRARSDEASEDVIDREIARRVGPIVGAAQRAAGAWLEAPQRPALAKGSVSVRPVKQQILLPVDERSVRTYTRKGRPLLLLPSSAYHTDELIELVGELRVRGFAPVAMLNNRRWETTGSALSRVDVPALKSLPPGDWLLDFAGLLTFNDWGEYYAKYTQHIKGRGPVSFGKVEGVQDWLDHDTGRIRNAYLASDVILCQGQNDVRALEGRRDRLEIVGSSRLEAIWNEPLPADAAPRVVGNVNFTYGVQTEHRDLWVETLREACRRAKTPLDLSLHPSETAQYPGLASTDPIRHLMVTDSVLVSRFSTVLFEGMARGCSVIYYNPHGEQVPTFHTPDGAFDLTGDPDELADFIAASASRTRAQAKERAARFFTEQVSMIPGRSPAVRTAEAIERNLAT